ncbi:helix-turn-helix domain-containing protein [Selenomonas ruminantium]|uniref:Helix-turn-helix domain-containing protein n=1 Tax=Selenomonas ruminantium TaxID=971 RepID=A0A1H3VUJ8_SELRU|nr:helix-turn-helix domain-containing protein [Selenomonas ruminantium]SDZ77914.1 Helix-turn-helix domain-containing protein [Selenomonas ruminantium]
MDNERRDKLKAYEGSVLDQGYGVVGKRVMRDRSIKIGAKGLYCYLCVYGHEVFPKRDTICYDLGISRDTYNSYLKELVTHGYVSVKQRRGEGNKFAGNVYTINIKLAEVADGGREKPQREISATGQENGQSPCPKIPATEKSCTEKPCTETSATEEMAESPAVSSAERPKNAANNTIINSTINNQYNKTTTPTTNIDDKEFSSAGDVVAKTLMQVQEARHNSVVVDDEVRALMDLGEQEHIEKKSILFFVSKYGKEAVKTQLRNLGFAEKRGSIDNPGGWLNCALQNGYSNLAAEKAMTKHKEAVRKQEAIKRMLEEEANKPVPPPDVNSVFYQMYVKNIKKAEG